MCFYNIPMAKELFIKDKCKRGQGNDSVPQRLDDVRRFIYLDLMN